MARIRNLIRLAIAAGPTIYPVIKKYWPMIKELVDKNPEVIDGITGRVSKLVNTKKHGNRDEILQRIQVLREQVTYVYASADNVTEAEEAKRWRIEIASIERALPVLDAMGAKQKKTELNRLGKRLDELSAKILAASIREDVEDAEIVDED